MEKKIESKQNRSKHASRKRIPQLINSQTEKDTAMLQKVNTNAVITDNITHIESSPGINYVTYNLIMPKGMANKVPCITQDGEYEDQISPCNDPNELGGNQGHPRQL